MIQLHFCRLPVLALVAATVALGSCGEQQSPAITANATDSSVTSAEMVKPQAKVAADTAKRITPGVAIGDARIGMDAAAIVPVLGAPDLSDAAMGKAWLTWKGHHKDVSGDSTELNVYITYSDSSMATKTVQQIRSTSPFFRTASGAGVSVPLRQLEKAFAGLKEAFRYKYGGRMVHVYTDDMVGIAFETVQMNGAEICSGVLIYRAGTILRDSYIYLHPDARKLRGKTGDKLRG